jgi:phage gpG-like protein
VPTITLPEAAFRIRKFGYLVDNMVINVMTLTLRHAQGLASNVFMLPKSLTSPVDPYKLTKRTGRLASTLRIDRPRVFGNRFIGALMAGGAAAPYAGIHERGGTINHPGSRAKPGGTLAWTPRGGGDTVFARSTKAHTITIPARPFVKPSVVMSLPYLEDNLQRGVARIRSEAGL